MSSDTTAMKKLGAMIRPFKSSIAGPFSKSHHAPTSMSCSQSEISGVIAPAPILYGIAFVLGPFRFSRNPLYLARTFLYVGLALAMNTFGPLFTLVPLLVIVHYGIVRPEERYLDAKFGETYRRYRTHVRRWL